MSCLGGLGGDGLCWQGGWGAASLAVQLAVEVEAMLLNLLASPVGMQVSQH